MTKAEERARRMIAGLSTERLLEQWELTTDNNDENIYTIRGWLMDEIERRYPETFEKWLDEDAEDENLRKYIA